MTTSGPSPASPAQEGLGSATEFLRYMLALGTSALVFGGGLVGEKIAFSPVAAGFLVVSWLALGISVAAGALAYARIPVKLAAANYDLHCDKYFTIPIRVNNIAFLFGMIFLGLALAISLIAKALSLSPHYTDKGTGPVVPVTRVLSPPLLLGHVGPFVSGRVHEIEPRLPGENWLRVEDVPAELRARSQEGEVGYLILVGSADKTELASPLRQQYGSNSSLARLRAESVRRAVEADIGHSISTLALVTGAEVSGVRLSPVATRSDRSVAVYVAWWRVQSATAQ